MSDKTREALERCADTLEMLCNGLEWNIENHPTTRATREALQSGKTALADARVALAAEPAQPEPAAWMVVGPIVTVPYMLEDTARYWAHLHGGEVLPLYTTAPTQAEQGEKL